MRCTGLACGRLWIGRTSVRGFRRRRDTLVAILEHQEIDLVMSLIEQMVNLLNDEALGGLATGTCGFDDELDLFERLERELGEPAGDLCSYPDTDPVLARLFPDAYPDDSQASTDFRRFTQCAQRDAKMAACVQVLDDLASVSTDGTCVVEMGRVDSWLITLTNLRLAVAVRLGIEDAQSADALAELPASDPRAWVFDIYEWLGWVQESLLSCLE